MNNTNIWQPWIDFWVSPTPAPEPEKQNSTGSYCIETKFDMKSGVVTVRHEFGW